MTIPKEEASLMIFGAKGHGKTVLMKSFLRHMIDVRPIYIFDIYGEYTSLRKEGVEVWFPEIWSTALFNKWLKGLPPHSLIIVDEAHLVLKKRLQLASYPEILKLLTGSRHTDKNYILCSQLPRLISSEGLELAHYIYWGKLNGMYNFDVARAYDISADQLKRLKKGQFIEWHDGKTRMVSNRF